MLTRGVGGCAEGAGGLACSTAALGPGPCRCIEVCSAASLLTSTLCVADWQVVGCSIQMCNLHKCVLCISRILMYYH